MFRVVAPILCLAALGCSSTYIDADDYNRDCVEDFECMVIRVGDICECTCDFSAIHADDFSDYLDDVIDADCSDDCGTCSGEAEAYCSSGTCEAHED